MSSIPRGRGFPDGLRKHGLTLNAYRRGRSLRAQEYVTGGGAGPALEQLLARNDVDYIHVRDTEAGCYDFRVERAERVSESKEARIPSC